MAGVGSVKQKGFPPLQEKRNVVMQKGSRYESRDSTGGVGEGRPGDRGQIGGSFRHGKETREIVADFFLDSCLLLPLVGLGPLSCFPLGVRVGKYKGMAEGLEEVEESNIIHNEGLIFYLRQKKSEVVLGCGRNSWRGFWEDGRKQKHVESVFLSA